MGRYWHHSQISPSLHGANHENHRLAVVKWRRKRFEKNDGNNNQNSYQELVVGACCVPSTVHVLFFHIIYIHSLYRCLHVYKYIQILHTFNLHICFILIYSLMLWVLQKASELCPSGGDILRSLLGEHQRSNNASSQNQLVLLYWIFCIFKKVQEVFGISMFLTLSNEILQSIKQVFA